MSIDIEALRHIPLFVTLSREELAHVAALTTERHYDRGDIILLEGNTVGEVDIYFAGILNAPDIFTNVYVDRFRRTNPDDKDAPNTFEFHGYTSTYAHGT